MTDPSLLLSAIPVVALLLFIAGILIYKGADSISDYSVVALLSTSALALVLSFFCGSLCRRGMIVGFRRSARQILPAVPMLIFISMISTTWVLSGVVPLLIEWGLRLLNPTTFLVVCCVVCGLISVLTGSSWSTIATLGVAFMGIGTIMGFHVGWVAGAIISGAYFGDKVSPLSDTTVVASSACGVDLFKHIRYLMLTSIPAMLVALVVFFVVGLMFDPVSVEGTNEVLDLLNSHFNLAPAVLLIPVITFGLIALRVNTLIVLFVSSMLGLAGIFIFQPGIAEWLGVHGPVSGIVATAKLLWSESVFTTGHELFDNLVSTSGITGMLSTILLVLSAMVFGMAMIGTGMLSVLTRTLTKHIHTRFAIVGSTVGSGLFLNGFTADQYLALIIGGNMYRNAYRRLGLEPRLLSRTLEDSVSVTSVLIPWNSCGVTQAAVLEVSTIVYMPYCVFNYLSPIMSLVMAWTGFKIKQRICGQKITSELSDRVIA
ncbi:MAG: sodium:proton antiporter [Muribaculaceae bacterium]|nr:sodium:proton antiporter [Muribaculaceae bacterium]